MVTKKRHLPWKVNALIILRLFKSILHYPIQFPYCISHVEAYKFQQHTLNFPDIELQGLEVFAIPLMFYHQKIPFPPTLSFLQLIHLGVCQAHPKHICLSFMVFDIIFYLYYTICIILLISCCHSVATTNYNIGLIFFKLY